MKCDACPVKDGACVGENGKGYACKWALTGNPIQAAHIIARSSGYVSPPPPAFLPSQPQPERKPLREASALLTQMRSCPHWVPRSDCGCGVNYCSRDDRTVSRQDCFACLKGVPDE